MKRRTLLVVALSILVAAALGVAATLAVRLEPPPRDIVLTARGMAFYLEGDDTPNPAIRVREGEYVRFILRNEAPGFYHDLAIPDLHAAVDPVPAGESRAFVVRIPRLAGPIKYHCRPHGQMMSGLILPEGS
ncbi:MAG TPA: hypothetical protein VNK41_03230 [Vicinamibacterales bacterium]|nr:hypothetical protein [Vicinamibacterales bacterium]